MDYLKLLKEELVLAMGCTEPACVALCAAGASELLGGALPERAEIAVSSYIAKNGMFVGIPGTDGLAGLPIAAALGIAGKNPARGLDLLRYLSPEERAQAEALLPRVRISVESNAPKVFAQAALTTAEGKTAYCVVSGRHDNIAYRGPEAPGPIGAEPDDGPETSAELSFDGILRFCKETPAENLLFLREVIEVNMAIAREGLGKAHGLAVGYNMARDMREGRLGGDSANHIVALTAAAADARMAGSQHSVMSTAGSGNQGLTASVPIIALAQGENRTEDELLRALALSELMTIYAKRHIGRLSILCGCSIAAAVGVCAGVVMLGGGGREQMALAINSLIADISGVICDGAKPGCALKIATATASALRAASLALRGCGAGSRDGIVCAAVEDTLANLGLLGSLGMRETNQVVLDMMMQKVQ